MDKYELAEYVNNNLPKGIRKVLFGDSEVDPSYISTDTIYLYSAIQLQFLLCYSEWNRCGRPKTDDYYLKKAFKTFERMFYDFDMSLDVILYALSNCERDVHQNKEKSFFYDYFEIDPFFKYSRLFDVINKCPEYEKWENIIFDMSQQLFSNAKVLRHTEIDEEQKTFLFNGNIYPFCDYFMVEKKGFLDSYWVIDSITKQNCSASEIRYVYSMLGEPDKQRDILKKI